MAAHTPGSDRAHLHAVLDTRGAAVIVALLLVIGTIAFYTSNVLPTELAVLTSDGAMAACWTAGACCCGAMVLRTLSPSPGTPGEGWSEGDSEFRKPLDDRNHPHPGPLPEYRARGPERALHIATAGGLGLGIFSLVGLGLGLLGWLNQITALALPFLSILAFAIQLFRHRPELHNDNITRWWTAPAGRAWFWLMPAIALATASVVASDLPGDLWKPMDPHPYDVVSYHLQVPREWFEAGRIVPLRHNVFSYFPFNVEMQYLLLMHATGGPWRAMYACQFMSVAYTALMLLAIAGASEFGVIGAAFAAVVPWTIMLGGVAYEESALMLYTALALVWALRACCVLFLATPGSERTRDDPDSSGARRNPGRRNTSEPGVGAIDAVSTSRAHSIARQMILAGVFAGFAAGVKITAVPMLLLALPIAFAITHLHRRRVLVGCALLLVAGSLVLSPWLLRTFAWSGGNPVFPLAMKVLGKAHFTDGQVRRFIIAHSAPADERAPLARLRVTWNDVIAQWQFGFVILPLALAAAAARWRQRGTWALLFTAAIIFIVWIGFTHLLGRFLIMLVPIAALLIGRVRWGRTSQVAAVVLLIVSAVFSWRQMYWRLAQTTRDPLRSALIGRQDLTFTIPEELLEMRDDNNKQVGLVGDAGAFLYQIPMTRLHYRTVFDVPADDSDPIDAWVGPQAKGDRDWLLVVNPTEINRLHRTYIGIPALPADWASRGDQPFVLRGDRVGK